MRNPGFARTACIVLAFWAAAAIASRAQTFTTAYSFEAGYGAYPESPLIQGTDGYLYGTTYEGGSQTGCQTSQGLGCGTAYGYSGSGQVNEVLFNFYCNQFKCAQLPSGGLVQAANGNFYGTTQGGYTYNGDCGGYGCGTVFELTTGSVMTTLYTFPYTNAKGPRPGLVQAANGILYGTTEEGGSSNGGTLFGITQAGKLTTLYNFCAKTNCTDGKYPLGTLIQATNGNLYGTTANGGSHCVSRGGCGTVFEIAAAGKLTTLYSFCSQTNCADGAYPSAALIQATNGNFYGTTVNGGAHCVSGGGCGTVFKITPAGKLTTLYSFCSETNCTDGSQPLAELVQATDGNFYGTTFGGASGGTVFAITPAGRLTTLYRFCSQTSCADGLSPMAALLQDTSGVFYGTTYGGGAHGVGTIFSVSMGLGPFVKTQPVAGKVGTKVKILGTDLSGSTQVSFNGKPAGYTVVSPTEITTTVPAGATTGCVKVTTPTGTLKSNVAFRLIP